MVISNSGEAVMRFVSRYLAYKMAILIFFITSCGRIFEKEIIFVWFDVSGSYGEFKDRAIEDFTTGIRNLLSTSHLMYLFKNYHLVIGRVGKTAGPQDILFSSELSGKRWDEIHKIIQEIGKIKETIKYKRDIYTEIDQAYVTMNDYIKNFMERHGLRIKPRYICIFYSDMIHTTPRKRLDPKDLNMLTGGRFYLVFAIGDTREFRRQVEFIKALGAEARVIHPSEMLPPRKSFFEAALQR